jgi:hypothetical protein
VYERPVDRLVPLIAQVASFRQKKYRAGAKKIEDRKRGQRERNNCDDRDFVAVFHASDSTPPRWKSPQPLCGLLLA